jgi:hypothetical protein
MWNQDVQDREELGLVSQLSGLLRMAESGSRYLAYPVIQPTINGGLRYNEKVTVFPHDSNAYLGEDCSFCFAGELALRTGLS